MDFLVERIIEETHNLGLCIQVTVAAHAELAVTQSRKHAMIADVCIAGVERARFFERTIQSHERIVRLIGALNRKRRNDTVKRLLRKRQRIAPPVEDVPVHAERGNNLILRNLLVWRNGVHLGVRVHLPQLRKVLRAVDDKDAKAFRTRCKEFKQLRPHRAKSPCSAQMRSIASVTALR